MNVFDRNAKRIQRNRTAALPEPEMYDYIKDEVRCNFISLLAAMVYLELIVN